MSRHEISENRGIKELAVTDSVHQHKIQQAIIAYKLTVGKDLARVSLSGIDEGVYFL